MLAEWLKDRISRSPRAVRKSRPRPKFGWPETAILAVYSLLLALGIMHHESWFDEVQAWQIARDSSLYDLFVHRLHYEGAPGFWHFLLWCQIRVGLSFDGMRVVTGVLAATGVAVWLRYNPLPRLVSFLVPFTFFLQYQYAVIARSYALAPLFVFVLLTLYSNRRSSPYAFCIVAGLFANCSLHMAAFSAGLVVVYAVDRLWPRGEERTLTGRAMLAPGMILASLFLVAPATAVPTADGSSTTSNPIVSSLRRLGHKPVADTPALASSNIAAPANAAAIPPEQGAIASAVWRAVALKPDATPKQALRAGIVKHILVLLTAITVPVSTSNFLALTFLGMLCWALIRIGKLIAMLPYVLVQACNTLISGEAHHLGLVWIALLAAQWVLALNWLPRSNAEKRVRVAFYLVTLVVVALQIGWSVHALRADWHGAYSGSKATAAYLGGLEPGTRVVAFDDDSITVNAYLPHSPYENQTVDYWPFSRTKNPSLFFVDRVRTQPAAIILKLATPVQPVMNQWVTLVRPGTPAFDQDQFTVVTREGYRETHRFCGQRFFRNSAESVDCRVVFEKPTR